VASIRGRLLVAACVLGFVALAAAPMSAGAGPSENTHFILGTGTLNSGEGLSLTIRATDQPGRLGQARIRRATDRSDILVALDCVVVEASLADRREAYASGVGSDGNAYAIMITGFDALPWRNVHAGVRKGLVPSAPCGAAGATYTLGRGWFVITP
jgi:hypothetical protein